MSPENITIEEALRRFLKMLASYKLKSVAEGNIYRIVQATDADK